MAVAYEPLKLRSVGGLACCLFFTGRDCGGDPGPGKGYTEDRMHGTEQRKLAIETYVKFDLSAADTVAELGYPTRHSLRAWHKDHLEHGEVRPPEAAAGAQARLGDEAGCRGLLPRARKEARQDHAQDGLSRQQGVPLRLDRRARPGQRKYRGTNPKVNCAPKLGPNK